MPFSLADKRIVVTGASSGIGRAVAYACGLMGARMCLLGRDERRLAETQAQLPPGQHHFKSLDLARIEEIEPFICADVGQYGPIDGLVHAAGIEMTVPLQAMRPRHYQSLFSINVHSGFELARVIAQKKHAGPNGGSLVFIASVMGMLGQGGKVGYCASKGALISGVKALAVELAPKHIRVNSISPALVETDMSKKLLAEVPDESKNAILANHPLGLGRPEDVAYACVYLLSDAAKWVTGSNLVVDGGYSAK